MRTANSSSQDRFTQAVSEVMGSEVAAELPALFHRLATMPYEEAESAGFLALSPPDHPALALVRLETPVRLRDVRGVRKMLHVSSPDLRVLCDGRSVYGFTAQADCRALLVVEFQRRGVWRLMLDGVILVEANARETATAVRRLHEERFQAHVQEVFGSLAPRVGQGLWTLIEAAARQSRGTNVLISANAGDEAARLTPQCTRVRPFALTPAIMERVTTIDGTVIIDPEGVCHAIGAILDGGVSDRGDRTRGGRFNSALMYVDARSSPSLILVVSHDGMVNLVSRQRVEVL